MIRNNYYFTFGETIDDIQRVRCIAPTSSGGGWCYNSKGKCLRVREGDYYRTLPEIQANQEDLKSISELAKVTSKLFPR